MYASLWNSFNNVWKAIQQTQTETTKSKSQDRHDDELTQPKRRRTTRTRSTTTTVSSTVSYMNELEKKAAVYLISVIKDPRDIARLSMVSKYWNKLATDNKLWYNLFYETFSTDWLPSEQRNSSNWKNLFGLEVSLAKKCCPYSFSTVRVIVDFDVTKKEQTFAYVMKKIRANSIVCVYSVKLNSYSSDAVEWPSHRLIDTPYEPAQPMSYFQLFGTENLHKVGEVEELTKLWQSLPEDQKKHYKQRADHEPVVHKKRLEVLKFLEDSQDEDLEKWKYEKKWISMLEKQFDK